jgi:hypothetical protein
MCPLDIPNTTMAPERRQVDRGAVELTTITVLGCKRPLRVRAPPEHRVEVIPTSSARLKLAGPDLTSREGVQAAGAVRYTQ